MKEGVYRYQTNNDNLRQVTFINLRFIGSEQGRKVFDCESITFNFVQLSSVFKNLDIKRIGLNDLRDLMPVSVYRHKRSLVEGGHMYNYYNSVAEECNLQFRFIEYLYENMLALKKTVVEIIDLESVI